MKNLEDAKRLAQTMVRIGKLANRQTMAVISDMSQPLGEAIGNSLEVVEAIETLQGKGPKDLEEMCYALGSQMVVLAKKLIHWKKHANYWKKPCIQAKR